MSLSYANFEADFASKNSIFNKESIDNRNYSFYALREKFLRNGIILNTPDLNFKKNIAFELHLNARKKRSKSPAYLLMWESNAIHPKNQCENLLNQYNRIFTWNENLVDNKKYFKFNLPVFFPKNIFTTFGWSSRARFSCLIASNKIVTKKDYSELYSKRIETIRWFEKNAPEDFELYGIGWNNIPKTHGILNRINFKIIEKTNKIFLINPFKLYRGEIKNKNQLLKNYRFSFCYENLSGLKGYITEKIFDCFFSGCIPIYWGASNISEYIPSNCYIDRCKFRNYNELYNYLKLMSEQEFISYQHSINNFLKSNDAKKFNSEEFCTNITSVIINDLVNL